MRNLIILRGVPGCGKTTFANLLSWEAGASCHAADDFFMTEDGYVYNPLKIGEAHKQCQEGVREEMVLKQEVIIVHNTNVKDKDFKVYEDLAKEFGYQITYLIVENRHGGKSVHGVPDETLERMRANLKENIVL